MDIDIDVDLDNNNDDKQLNNPLGLQLMDMNQSIRGNIVLLDQNGNHTQSQKNDAINIEHEHDTKHVTFNSTIENNLHQDQQQSDKNWNFSSTGTFHVNSKTHGSKFYIKNGITKIESNKSDTNNNNNHVNNTNHIFTSMDQIKIEETLGSGVSGTVKKAYHIKNEKYLALKYIDFHDKYKRKQFVDEMMLFLKYNHPCIVSFHGACVDNINGTVVLGLEFMNCGSLSSFIKNNMKNQSFTFTQDQCKQLTNNIISSLSYLQFNKICHRDIKPENILVHFDQNSSNQIVFKLADFGLNKCMESTVGFAKTQIGTLLYMSPERMLGEKYNWKSDVWSFGLVLLYCINGAQSPYKCVANQGPLAVHMAIVEQDVPKMPQFDHNNQPYSINFHSFIQACLYKDPQKRWTASDLLMHPFLIS